MSEYNPVGKGTEIIKGGLTLLIVIGSILVFLLLISAWALVKADSAYVIVGELIMILIFGFLIVCAVKTIPLRCNYSKSSMTVTEYTNKIAMVYGDNKILLYPKHVAKELKGLTSITIKHYYTILGDHIESWPIIKKR